MISKNNLTPSALYSESASLYGPSFIDKVTNDSDFTTLVLILGLFIILNVGLLVYHITTRHKRPIIRKRVIVNKNVTPLTYRPQPTTEQCEITIENCCNMNVCETVSYSICPDLLEKSVILGQFARSSPITQHLLPPLLARVKEHKSDFFVWRKMGCAPSFRNSQLPNLDICV